MASGDTKTNQYLDIAANGTRADLPTDTCCETRSQTLIRGVAERIMNVEDELERLENNPDVADIVATYADLQAYNTDELTDKDVVRVLQDETHNGDSTYYRWSTQTKTWAYIGESKQYTDFVGTDGKTDGEAGLVPAPTVEEAGYFLNANGDWARVQASAVTELTEDDYNWPTANPDGIALWLLDEGIYSLPLTALKVYYGAGAGTNVGAVGDVYIVSKTANSQKKVLSITHDYDSPRQYNYSNVYNGIGSVSYIPTVAQTTGTSTTGVMSQNATTSMVYADPTTRYKVQIGDAASTVGTRATAVGAGASASGQRATALGDGASARGSNSVALGRGSIATEQGQMDISEHNGEGYNNSNYRLLTGLYTPQDAHDAANKEYVDPTTDSSAPTTATVGRLGQIQIDTSTSTAYMCVGVDAETPEYTWKQITA